MKTRTNKNSKGKIIYRSQRLKSEELEPQARKLQEFETELTT